MYWNDHKRDIPKDAHAFLSPSSYSWFNYSDDKLLTTYINKLAAARGTALHDLASRCIKLKQTLPNEQKTLNMFVNDAIHYKMESEMKLYYSKFCFGTADAISINNNKLKIFDLKTGIGKTSFMQLRIYAALFFLEYKQYKVSKISEIELRIYQNDEIRIENPGADDIVPVMDRIKRFSKILQELEDKYDEGFEDLS